MRSALLLTIAVFIGLVAFGEGMRGVADSNKWLYFNMYVLTAIICDVIANKKNNK